MVRLAFATFHFPELMINRVTGDATNKQTKCPECKVIVGLESLFQFEFFVQISSAIFMVEAYYKSSCESLTGLYLTWK